MPGEVQFFPGETYDIEVDPTTDAEEPTVTVFRKDGEIETGLLTPVCVAWYFPEGIAHLADPQKVDELAIQLRDNRYESDIRAFEEFIPTEWLFIQEVTGGLAALQRYVSERFGFRPFVAGSQPESKQLGFPLYAPIGCDEYPTTEGAIIADGIISALDVFAKGSVKPGSSEWMSAMRYLGSQEVKDFGSHYDHFWTPDPSIAWPLRKPSFAELTGAPRRDVALL